MSVRNSTLRYGGVAMTFHWIIAALILTNIVLGFWFGEFMSHQDPIRFTIIQLHKSIGLSVLVLSVLRLAWRLINPVPPLPRGMGMFLRVISRLSHYTLYFMMIAIPLAGWAMVSSSPLGNPTMFFGLFAWPQISFLADMARPDKMHYVKLFGATHNLLAFATIGLFVIHVTGALYHQFLRRDDVVKRMIPGTQVSDPA